MFSASKMRRQPLNSILAPLCSSAGAMPINSPLSRTTVDAAVRRITAWPLPTGGTVIVATAECILGVFIGVNLFRGKCDNLLPFTTSPTPLTFPNVPILARPAGQLMPEESHLSKIWYQLEFAPVVLFCC